MTPEQISQAILQALSALESEGRLPGGSVPTEVVVERPKNREHGDWATNVAMQLANQVNLKPREFAGLLSEKLSSVDGIEKVSIAGPGFINLFVSDSAAGALAKQIVELGDQYGLSKSLTGQKLNLEFVSANPTGPIHLGGTRWAAVGDSLARILQSQGASVVREYYFNDHGAQIDRFAISLLAAAKGEPTPEDGYAGSYIQEIATAIVKANPGVLNLETSEAQEEFRKAGVEMMFEQIKQSLHDFGVDFDVYFHENSLYESGAVEKSVEKLKSLGHMFEQEGALWLRSSSFGDDRDRVVIKSDGNASYIAGDIAYYLDKRSRGFDRAIYMLGADHHGYIGRMHAVCAAFGDKPGENMEILIGQLVSLVRAGEPVRMSKRAGTVVTMEDLVEAVGVDAARYALVRSSINSTLDVDLELLAKKTNDNPVFYVQYAHARTKQVDRNAAESGVKREQFSPELLSSDSEQELLAKLSQFPGVVTQAAEFREPHRVARYLEELAGAYHRFYDNCRILPLPTKEVEPVHQTRLWLNDAAGIVLANGLKLLGVSAPERM
ncbi:MAG: arginine--tRNA ligase [Aquiluna sp.]